MNGSACAQRLLLPLGAADRRILVQHLNHETPLDTGECAGTFCAYAAAATGSVGGWLITYRDCRLGHAPEDFPATGARRILHVSIVAVASVMHRKTSLPLELDEFFVECFHPHSLYAMLVV